MIDFAGIAQRERLSSRQEVAGETPAPRSTSAAEETGRDILLTTVAVLVASAIAVALGLGGVR